MSKKSAIRRWGLRLAAVAGVLVAIAVIAAVVAAVASPREWTTRLTRKQLEWSGLERQTWEHDQGQVTYFRGGDGEPMVFVHGIADQAGSWFRVSGRFQSDYTVTVFDLPAHGDSPIDGGDILDESARRVMFELFDRWSEEEPMVLVANSLGGWLALEYALEHPSRVRRVVAASPAGIEYQVDREILMPSTREEARTMVRAIFGDRTPWVPGFVLDRIVERTDDSVIADVWNHLDEVDYLDDELGDLEVPVTLLWGSEDLIFPLDYARRFDAAIPDSELHVLDGCGHAPQVACPDEFSEAVERAVE